MPHASDKNQDSSQWLPGQSTHSLGDLPKGSSRPQPQQGGMAMEAAGRDPPAFQILDAGSQSQPQHPAALQRYTSRLGNGEVYGGKRPKIQNKQVNLAKEITEDTQP